MTSTNPTFVDSVWNDSSSGGDTLREVADRLGKVTGLDVEVALDERSFRAAPGDGEEPAGVRAARGELVDGSMIRLELEVVRAPDNLRPPARKLLAALTEVDERCRLRMGEEEDDQWSLHVVLGIDAAPLTPARSDLLLTQLTRLDKLARDLQKEIPRHKADEDLEAQYRPFAKHVDVLTPGFVDDLALTPELEAWAKEALSCLVGNRSVAVAGEPELAVTTALLGLARIGKPTGHSFARLTGSPDPADLVKLASHIPGHLIVSSTWLGLVTNEYRRAEQVRNILADLQRHNAPAIFVGSLNELQSQFHGGQGGENNPLKPVLAKVPSLPIETLVRFAIRLTGKDRGGLAPTAEAAIQDEVMQAVDPLRASDRRRLLDSVASHAVSVVTATGPSALMSTPTFAAMLAGRTETLSGLSARPRVERRDTVESRYVEVLTHDGIVSHLSERLVGQDAALAELGDRLDAEAKTRDSHQPLRYCAQGVPGTGKSHSAELLARLAGVPYVNIDSVGLPDHHTATAQLLGSGRGIVGSHQPGRLEQVAKHHTGVVVEISDLDHAHPGVRSFLADLFLQVLQSGEAQSSVGSMIDCSNLILAFTLNLPGGRDEAVNRSLGFRDAPSRGEVRDRVKQELKHILSGAFVSRIGDPILFSPLDRDAWGVIAERAMVAALQTAARRLDLTLDRVRVHEDCGARFVDSLGPDASIYGARAILDAARLQIARALRPWLEDIAPGEGHDLEIRAEARGSLSIRNVA